MHIKFHESPGYMAISFQKIWWGQDCTLGFPLSDKPTDFAIRGRYLQESPADGFQLEVTAQGFGGVQPKGPV